jgi:hypothetical protein
MFLLFALMLHSLLWILLAVITSTLAPNRSHAAAVLLSLWACSTIVIPRFSGGIASEAHPLPTRSEFTDALEADLLKLGDSHNDQDPIFQKLREETLRLHGVNAVEALPLNYRALVMAPLRHGCQCRAVFLRASRALALPVCAETQCATARPHTLRAQWHPAACAFSLAGL